MKRLLITGAAGGIGSQMRKQLAHLADTLRLADRVDLGTAAANEELVTCDMGDREAVDRMVEGCDGIVHLGGQPVEDTWEVIRNANIDGLVHLYEAARRHGTKRILFASSNHAVGFHRQDTVIDADARPRPDTYYGVSKVFGESIASMYYDKFGIETASVRIGSCFPRPENRRMLSTWMSFEDFARLCERVFRAPKLGCPIIYGCSDNKTTFWDNSKVAYLGWRPEDSSEPWRAEVEGREPLDPDAAVSKFQGGGFTEEKIHEG